MTSSDAHTDWQGNNSDTLCLSQISLLKSPELALNHSNFSPPPHPTSRPPTSELAGAGHGVVCDGSRYARLLLGNGLLQQQYFLLARLNTTQSKLPLDLELSWRSSELSYCRVPQKLLRTSRQ
mmetsp:Transcript_10305/g.21188  ORF Transcript_10305/g.21188 Transcript_10305/m.21188 type:complete len:123 (+) Transcript_10305:1973-2341(+)